MQAARLLRQPAGRLLSRSSITVRTPGCRAPARAFHASAARQDALLDTLLYLPHEMMSLLHANVPWYAALPLAAFITRGLLVTTAGSWARSLTARYVGLQPLRQALAFQKQDEIMRRGNFRSPQEAIKAVKTEVNDMAKQLDARWKVSLRGQISWTIAQIPIFFTMAEVIRQMCGARDGLLAIFSSVFSKSDDAANIGELAAAPSPWFEPSLANEGMLWFQDLLLPDPTGALPFIVSGLMFSNIYFTNNTVKSDATWPLLIRRTMLGVTLLVGPLCQGMPAALMLYWGASTSSVILWNLWLGWRYPAPQGLTACKRPLLMPPAPAGPKGLKRQDIQRYVT